MVFGEDHCKSVDPPFALSITTSVITILLAIITLPGNLFICVAMATDPYKDLRTSFNYLLLNIAVSDLIIGAVTDPLVVYFHIREGLGYTVSSFVVPHMSFFIGCTASLLSIAMLAVERSTAANSNFHRRLTKNRVTIMSIVIWVFSAAFPCMYLKIGYLKMSFVFSILMLVVTSIIVATFIRICSNLRRNKNTVEPQTNDAEDSGAKIRLNRAEYERRVTSIFRAILIFYAICSSPALIFIFLVNTCATCNCQLIHWSRDFIQLCVLINCCGNQFLYAWRMRCFTRAFKALVKRQVVEGRDESTEYFPNTVEELKSCHQPHHKSNS